MRASLHSQRSPFDQPEQQGPPPGGTEPRQKPLPRISAVVVFWEKSRQLEECLRALRSAGASITGELEIIVVENGAGSDLWEEMAGLWDGWADLGKNLGPAAARNIGAQMARSELIAFIDDDGEVDRGFFEAALPYFDDPDVLGIRGRVVPKSHPYFATLAGHYDRGPEPLEDALITEGAALVRRTPFLEAQGFPEDIFGHEGIALTYQLQKLHPGGKTLYAPDVKLYHDYMESWSDFMEKSLRYALNEEKFGERDRELRDFLDHYFATSFPRSPLSIRKTLVRETLRLIRSGVQLAAKTARKTNRRLPSSPLFERASQ